MFMKHRILSLVLILILLLSSFNVVGQAATQTENWCPEVGTIQSSKIILWNTYDLTRYVLSDEGIELLQNFNTSGYVQAYYGSPDTDADNQWIGAPTDLEEYLRLALETDQGRRWVSFAASESKPDVMLGLMLLSKTVSGTGDQLGMHDICAVFTTTRDEVDALWDERVAVVRPSN